MPSTADTTIIAQGLGSARAVMRAIESLSLKSPGAQERLKTLAAIAKSDLDSGFEALKRIEGEGA